ncbi:hypothetical protein ZOSMA_75G00800 [Zostera marina]|uniref:Protein TIFY n=1 Tax=Zostera marina TaxID=29655 RepID=A0A0K9NPX6_ZOSMR|nr:hypothetical protein ZOSMA_75G00800 [Zostera marina]
MSKVTAHAIDFKERHKEPRNQVFVPMDGIREDAVGGRLTIPPPPLTVDGISQNMAQMMIYHDGSLRVFNSLTPEKVRQIMLIAATSDPISVPKILEKVPSFESSTAETPQASRPHDQAQHIGRLQSDFPLARRFSLQRFLEKRRVRLGNKTPYATPHGCAAVDPCSNSHHFSGETTESL